MTEKPAAGPAPATPSTPEESTTTDTTIPAAPAPAEAAAESTKRTRNWPVITAAVAGGVAVAALAFGGGLATGWNLNPGPESGVEFTDGSQMPEEGGPGSDDRNGPRGHDHPSESRDRDGSGPRDGFGPRGGDDVDDRTPTAPDDDADTDATEKDDADRHADRRDADRKDDADSDA